MFCLVRAAASRFWRFGETTFPLGVIGPWIGPVWLTAWFIFVISVTVIRLSFTTSVNKRDTVADSWSPLNHPRSTIPFYLLNGWSELTHYLLVLLLFALFQCSNVSQSAHFIFFQSVSSTSFIVLAPKTIISVRTCMFQASTKRVWPSLSCFFLSQSRPVAMLFTNINTDI